MIKHFALWLVATLFLSLLSPASAADIAYKARQAPDGPSLNWSGFYAGLHGGWGNSYDDAAISGTNTVAGFVVATGAVPGSLKTEANGWLIGGHVGYNQQFGSFVLGLEGTLAWTDIEGSAGQTLTLAPLGIPVGITSNSSTGLDWLGTIEARAGLLLTDRFLVFAKGGFAFGKAHSETSATLVAPAPFGATAAGSVSDTRTGWTVGGGVEYAIAPNWTLRGDYSYVDLGSETYAFGAVVGGPGGIPVTFQAHQDFTYHLVKVGTSLKF